MNNNYADGLNALLKAIGLDQKAILVRDASSQETIDITDVLIIFLNVEIGKREANIMRYKYGLTSQGKRLTFTDIGKKLGISRERVHQLHERTLCRLRKSIIKTGEVTHVNIIRTVDRNVSILSQSIETLGLNSRAYNRLKMMNISTIGDLVKESEITLWAIKGMGNSTVEHVKDRLKVKNLALKFDK